MLAVSMPKGDLAALVDTATKCFAIAASSAASSHARAVSALVIVSRVVKVFEETIKSVSAGSRSRGPRRSRCHPRWRRSGRSCHAPRSGAAPRRP